MSNPILDRHIDYFSTRLAELESLYTGPEVGRVQELLEELGIAMEELTQQSEELTLQQDALVTAGLRYQSLFNVSSDGFLLTDFAGLVQEANQAATQLLNVPMQHLIGKPLAMFVDKPDRTAFRLLLAKLWNNWEAYQRGGPRSLPVGLWEHRQMEIGLKPLHSDPFAAYLKVSVVEDELRKPFLWWEIRDHREVRHIQQALHEREETFRLMTETNPAAIFLCKDGKVEYANPAATLLSEYPLHSLIGKELSELFDPDLLKGARQAAQAGSSGPGRGLSAMNIRKQAPIEVMLRTAALSERWVSLTVGEILLDTGQVQIVTAYDITQSKQNERDRLALLRRLVSIQEEERCRIARELHDQMGQTITALTLGLKVIEGDLAPDSRGAKTLKQAQALTNKLGEETHQVALELRPSALDDLGLKNSMLTYLKDWAERNQIPVDLQALGNMEERLPAPVETALFRILQEALNNVIRHANATRVDLVLDRKSDEVRLIIEDNGQGFQMEAAQNRRTGQPGLGLLGMSERASSLGGTFSVESEPGKGTSVNVRIPLSGEGE